MVYCLHFLLAWLGKFSSLTLSYVFALAMVINFIMTALAGIGVHIVLQCFGIDPALASSALITNVIEVVGFLAFLGLTA